MAEVTSPSMQVEPRRVLVERLSGARGQEDGSQAPIGLAVGLERTVDDVRRTVTTRAEHEWRMREGLS